MTTVATLTTILDANTRGLDTGLNRANQNIGDFSRNAMGRLAGVAGVLGLGALATGAVNVAIEWEAAFADVMKTVDASDEQLATLSDTLRTMATSGTLGALENAHQTLAQIAASAGALGVETDAIDEFTQAVASLAVASDLTAEAGATFIARFANIAQLDLATQADNLADTLVTLGNNMAATESDIAGFANRLASLTTFSYSPDEILGLSAAMASLGISAELGGTNLLKTVTDITTAIATGGPELERFASAAGMTAAEFRALGEQDASGALMAFLNGLRQMDASEQIQTLQSLGITSAEQARVLMTMAAGFNTVAEGLEIAEVAWEGNGAAMTEAAAKAATTQGAINTLKNNLADLGIELASRTLPGITSMVGGLSDLVRGNFGAGLGDIGLGLAQIGDSLVGTDVTSGLQAFIDSMLRIDDINAAAEKSGNKDFNLFGATFELLEQQIADASSAIEARVDAFWADLGVSMRAGVTALADGVTDWFAVVWDNISRTFERGALEVQYQFLSGMSGLRDTILQNTGFDIAPDVQVSLDNVVIERGNMDTANWLVDALRGDMGDGELNIDPIVAGMIALDPAGLAAGMGLDARNAITEALRMAITEGDAGAISVLTPLANELSIDVSSMIAQIQSAIDVAAAGGFTANVSLSLNGNISTAGVTGGGSTGGASGTNVEVINVTSYGTNPRDLVRTMNRASSDTGR